MAKKGKKTRKDGAIVQFKQGDLVLAKVRGHPIWPAQVINVIGKKVEVKFFGEQGGTSSTLIDIKPFAKITEAEKNCKRKGFPEALEECFNHANGSVSSKVDDDNKDEATSDSKSGSSPAQPSTSSSPVQNALEIVEAESAVKRPDKKAPAPTNKQRKPRKRKAPPQRQKRENSAENKIKLYRSSNILPQTGKIGVDEVAEDEVMAKLRAKVLKKTQEKMARIDARKQMKIVSRAAENLVKINMYLNKFAPILREIATAQTPNSVCSDVWDKISPTFLTHLPALARCIQMYDSIKTPSEFRKCHDILQQIIENMKLAKQNDQVPKTIKGNIRNCLKRVKESETVKRFINNGPLDIGFNNAMIERKENDAK